MPIVAGSPLNEQLSDVPNLNGLILGMMAANEFDTIDDFLSSFDEYALKDAKDEMCQ